MKLNKSVVSRLATVAGMTLVMLASISAAAFAVTYTWNQTGTASWATATNWTPTRTTPATSDVLVFDNGATTTATNVPTQTIAQLLLSSSTNVTLQSTAATATLSIGGTTGTDLDVPAGSSLNISNPAVTAQVLIISVLTGATGSVSGAMSFSASTINTGHQLLAADASGVTFNSGAVFTQGLFNSGNVFGSGTSNSVVFAGGSTFNQFAGANPFQKTQPASVVVFQTGSNFRLLFSATPSFSGRTYSNFEYNPGTGTNSATGGGTLTIDNLTVSSGTLNIGMTGAFNLKGNVSVASGAALNFNAVSAALNFIVSLNGSSAQTITNGGDRKSVV